MPQKAMQLNGDEALYWNVERLWALSENLPIEKVPIGEFSSIFDSKLSFGPEGITFRGFVDHVRTMLEVDLSYPIILAAEGWIMDGRTRLQKALLEGHKEVSIVRFTTTPEPDEREKKG